jgi:hypothetical protein
MSNAKKLVMLLATQLAAAPPAYAITLNIVNGGVSGTNQLWEITLSPQVAAAVAVEIGIEFSGGSILSVVPNAVLFDDLNPGQNPFTGTITEGVSIHDFQGTADAAFMALGGLLPSLDEVLVATVTTNGPGVLQLGNQDHNGFFVGAVVAQQGVSFPGLTASLEVGGLSADFDANGAVNSADLSIWANQFGSAATPATGDANGNGRADGADFLLWQQQFGSGAASLAAAGVVPEPTSLAAAAMLLCGTVLRRRSR